MLCKVSYNIEGNFTEIINSCYFYLSVEQLTVGCWSHDGAGQSSVLVLNNVMNHREGWWITESVDFFSEALHCGWPSLPAQHFIAGQLVLELIEIMRWEERCDNSPLTYNAVLAAANIRRVRGVEQVVRLVLKLLDIKFPGFLSAYQVGSVVGPPGYWEQSRLLNLHNLTHFISFILTRPVVFF